MERELWVQFRDGTSPGGDHLEAVYTVQNRFSIHHIRWEVMNSVGVFTPLLLKRYSRLENENEG